MKNRLIRFAALAAGLTIVATGCSLDSASNSSGNVVNVVIGYQSKTINTVTATTPRSPATSTSSCGRSRAAASPTRWPRC